MNQRAVDLLITEHENLSPKAKSNFLLILKFDPDLALEKISSMLQDLAPELSIEAVSVASDSQELLTAFQEHFAEEMAIITQ